MTTNAIHEFSSPGTRCADFSRVLYIKNGYAILECTRCKNRFIEILDLKNHVNDIFNDKYFHGGHAGYPNYLEEKSLLQRTGSRYARLISKYSCPGRILDVGSAAGFILNGFKESGWECHGIEPNDTMASYGRTKLQLDIETNCIESFKSSKQFDLICMIQVIQHFYDLDKAMQNITDSLVPGGIILVESWDMNSLYAKLMGKHWHAYNPPSVVQWFSKSSLCLLFKYFNLELLASGKPVKLINLNHALFLINETYPKFYLLNKFSTSFVKMFGKMAVHYPPLDLNWYIFRKIMI